MYLIYMYKEDLGLNNLRWLICHKPNPTNDLVLNNLQGLIFPKTLTKPQTKNKT